MTASTMRAGDFTNLATDYTNYRPDYSPSVLTAILSLVGKPVNTIDFADVGAGTGIWTRMVAERGVRSAVAVEPNDNMREAGKAASTQLPIEWKAGQGERTGLADNSADLLTMASSFHWTDYDAAVKEFHRVLRPGGRFVALWNPRLIEVNPMLVEIENELSKLKSDIKRVSSGRSGITDTLTAKLCATPQFEDVVYIEGRHIINMTPERYIGAWRSVNDLQVQLGAQKFDQFLKFVENKISGLTHIEATYLTRAWAARRRA